MFPTTLTQHVAAAQAADLHRVARRPRAPRTRRLRASSRRTDQAPLA